MSLRHPVPAVWFLWRLTKMIFSCIVCTRRALWVCDKVLSECVCDRVQSEYTHFECENTLYVLQETVSRVQRKCTHKWAYSKWVYSVLQCVAVCCSVLQCVAVCCSVLQCVLTSEHTQTEYTLCCSVLQCVAVCCSVYSQVSILKVSILTDSPLSPAIHTGWRGAIRCLFFIPFPLFFIQAGEDS